MGSFFFSTAQHLRNIYYLRPVVPNNVFYAFLLCLLASTHEDVDASFEIDFQCSKHHE